MVDLEFSDVVTVFLKDGKQPVSVLGEIRFANPGL